MNDQTDSLSLDEARSILAEWRGRTVHVNVWGAQRKRIGSVLAVLHGKLSAERSGAVPNWIAYAVGDESGDRAITIHKPSFRDGILESGNLLSIRMDDGYIDVALRED